ncbi:mitochondrial 18 KDa protein-domain-containing protein [Podospora australis]|uniref:Mitochondrial fission process protein 1 n=1 Tax=Podospora australis TaxID=1536484 RepID=A0AAN6WW39_9PEZI|nr:mitochondrial 18 KDa protein-domain-containing protein [Podospora australis]
MVWPFGGSSDKPSADQKPFQPPNAVTDPKKNQNITLPAKDEKLPPKLQQIVDKSDKDDNFFDELVDGYAPPSTESNVRYAAYATRFRTILLSAHRYVAYTSDIGESFRPVAHPWLVRGAYGVSWMYILGDVSYEGYKSYLQNQRVRNPNLVLSTRQQQILGVDATKPDAPIASPGTVPPLEDYRTVMLQRGIFQSLASMGLPAFTIHSVVRYSGQAMKNVKNVRVRTWAPIGLGLAVVPFLPTLFDKPVENAVEWAFHKGFETLGGHDAVGNAPLIGREKQLSEKPKPKKD